MLTHDSVMSGIYYAFRGHIHCLYDFAAACKNNFKKYCANAKDSTRNRVRLFIAGGDND